MNESTENGAIIASKAAAYGGAFSAIFSGLTVSEIGVVVGIIVGVVGLILGQFWTWRKDRRDRAIANFQMRQQYGSKWDEI